MIEIKVWPEGPCDECNRKRSESIKTSIQELNDGVSNQAYNVALGDFRREAQKLIEEKNRTINKVDLFDIETKLIRHI